ncbi:MAG: hypothetical protein WA708_06155 [Acidobacteriaceae bacterium]
MGSPGAVVTGMQDEAQIVKNEPYQAYAVTELKQTLGNGSHIVQTTTAKVARDREGRTVRIQKLQTIGPWVSSATAQGKNPVLTTIFDPVSRTHIDYTSERKVATEMTIPWPPRAMTFAFKGTPPQIQSFVAGVGPSTVHADTAGGEYFATGHGVAPQIDGETDEKTLSLGTKTIEGIHVIGTRVTTTIPKGAIGNDRDLVITHETWYSPELKLVVRSIHDDPRFGQTTYSLTNIQRREPDEALFQVPAGYMIEKLPPPQTRRIMSHP